MSVALTINGITVSAERGQTILQVARENDIFIPTLCEYPGLTAHGSCRVCIVEVKGRPNTPTACTTLAEPGMVVETETPRIQELRQEILRMLLADHPAACLFCTENGHCQECMITLRKTGVTTGCHTCPSDGQCRLQEITERIGLKSVDYPVRYRALPVEKRDPFYDRDYNLCVLCGRCIQVCESLHFNNVPAYVHRGSETRVGTMFGQTHLEAGCSFCGACVDACPTGALSEKTRKWDGKPASETTSTCAFCSLGCEINLLTSNNHHNMIIGSKPGSGNRGLCVKGRFGLTEMLNHPDRLLEALYVEHGDTVRSSVKEAISKAAEHLSACGKNDFAMLVSASCSNEEMYVADKFSRDVMGVPAILDASARYGTGMGAVSRLMKISQPLETLDTADLIFCLDLDAKYAQSVAETYIKKALERGAQVITMNTAEHVPGRYATLWLKPSAGQEESMLAGLSNGGASGDTSEAARIIRDAKKPVLLASPEALVHLPEAIENLCRTNSMLLVAIPAEGNLAGALRLGLGSAKSSAEPKVLYLFGAAIPEKIGKEAFVIFQNTHLSSEKPENGILLPMAAYGETEGTMTDQAGQVKRLSAAISPAGAAVPGWEILCRIAQVMGKQGFDYSSIEEISQEMEKITFDRVLEVNPPTWLQKTGEHDFLGADLSRWVAGLRMLSNGQQEGEHVHTA